jgi:predicted phage terminase large subunit-like protein
MGGGRASDYTAIITGVMDCDAKTKTLYVLDVDIARRKPDETINVLLAYCKNRNVKECFVESNQFQALLSGELERRARNSNLSLSVKRVNNTENKLCRIKTLEPFIKSGAIQFSRRHRGLLDQLRLFPKGAHDDGIDALQMLYQHAQNYGYLRLNIF